MTTLWCHLKDELLLAKFIYYLDVISYHGNEKSSANTSLFGLQILITQNEV